jgi:hypothetical protein
MPLVGSEPTITVSERAKTVHATVTGPQLLIQQILGSPSTSEVNSSIHAMVTMNPLNG